ncbi:MAG: RAMP superfamily CRISPR-associated protein [Thermoguttaceae bacterium]|nr:RAMP superfamily CRISPR-associated protein [Thermoguttaceae bacterium]MDW8078429.1 RAMP superfamily CRISPR-associated protein [Thermoguttaceae bacterium]
MLRRWVCQADVVVQIEPQDPILVKSGYATLDGPDMVPVSTFRDGKQVYYLPGTSLKGVFRSHFERIARTLAPGSVCIPYYDPKKKKEQQPPVQAEKTSFGCGFRGPANGRPNTSATAYLESCPACRLFGSLRFAGRLSFSDAFALRDNPPTPSTRAGVGIDRFTGGVVPKVLFELRALEGGVYETNIRLINFEQWQLAALNFLLSDLADGMIYIGSGKSRGLGRVQGKVTAYLLYYAKPQNEFAALYEFATEDERAAYGLFGWSPSAPIPLPGGNRKGIRWQYDVSEDWQEKFAPLGDSLIEFLKQHRPLGDYSARLKEEEEEEEYAEWE